MPRVRTRASAISGAASGPCGRHSRFSLLFIAFSLVAAADVLEDIVPTWGGTGRVDHNHSHLGRELLQVNYHQPKIIWERNGERLKSGSIPEDSAIYTNRFQLYDRYGRWMVDPSYISPPSSKKTGYAKQIADKSQMTSPNQAINRDFEAKFWFGQALPDGGYAWSVPRKPWIRQGVPYTCETNPFDECPTAQTDRKKCEDDKCKYGKRVGKPVISPDGGEYQGNIMVAIEVDGARMFESKLPSKPNFPVTSFQNGLCQRKCANKPVFPACLDQLVPQMAVFGTEMLEGFMRPEILQNPCKGADKHYRRMGFECKCNVNRLACDPETSFCDVKRSQCLSVVGKECTGIPDKDLLEETCGRPQLGGTCGFGTWYEVDKCVDDYTPVWPDADYQNAPGLEPQRVSSDCRNVVCSDHTQCIHIYYTLDGSTPTRRSRLYHGPFLIDTTVPVTSTVVQDLPFAFITVKAIAVQEGNLDSDILESKVFYIQDSTLSTGKGRVWSWGHNTRGQLGLGDGLYGGDKRFPNEIPGAPAMVMPSFCFDPITEELLPERKCDPSRWVLTTPQANLFNADYLNPPIPEVVTLVAGAYHNIMINEFGKLETWGWNGYGQLGNPINQPTYRLPAHPSDDTQRNLPTPAKHVDQANEKLTFVTASAGVFHSAAVDVVGHAYFWGNNYEGQLCLDSTSDVNFPSRTVPEWPTDDHSNAIPGARWVQVALGAEHSALLASTGEVYACGSNRVYQLGRPRFFPDTGDGLLSSCLQDKTPNGCPTEYNLRWTKPVRVLGGWEGKSYEKPLQRVVKIAAGSFHTIALTADGTVFAWGDNRMNQLGLGPLVARGNPCCAVPVPFYVDNSIADLEPDGGPGGRQPGSPVDPAWPWPGYKVLDISAGAHFSLAIVINISGPACSETGETSGIACVRQNVKNGLTEQDWDVPRNLDILGDHFRADHFDFTKAVSCGCKTDSGIHLPGGLANCDENTYSTLVNNEDGTCYDSFRNKTFRCRYNKYGQCPNGDVCQGPADCDFNGYCDRMMTTCSSKCPCGDRSCPGKLDDGLPSKGDPITRRDSWLRRAVKKGNTCGCTPGILTEACQHWMEFQVIGALPDCCYNKLPEAPKPYVKLDKGGWDEFNNKYGYLQRYGTCPQSKQCIRANPRGCLQDICIFPEHSSQTSGEATPDDGHPEYEIGNRKTCWCYEPDTCVGTGEEEFEGLACTKMEEQEICGLGYCTRGGGSFQAGSGASPLFWGDCVCRNASVDEWSQHKNTLLNASQRLGVNQTRAPIPRGIHLQWTFWDSNPCPYHNGVNWAGADCRLVRPPFHKYMMGWGDTRAGQLARQLATLKSPDDQPQNLFRPTRIPSLDQVDLIAVAAGDFHAAAISNPQPHAVCNLSHVDEMSKGVPVEEGGYGPDHVRGDPFQCDGNVLYTWGGNTHGELGQGMVTPSAAFDCLSIGNVRVPCENMGGALTAMRVKDMIGRNVTQLGLGFKHTNLVLGDCPENSKDRCGICFGTNRECVGCSGITNKKVQNDWCGVCDGDGTTCSGCQRQYECNTRSEQCLDSKGENIACSPVESYNPCHQGHKKGFPCCLDVDGHPSTPDISDPGNQKLGKAAGNGPVPCSHFGVTSWRDRPRAGLNYCGLTYDSCDVCDGDHTRCLDCFGVNHGKLTIDVCDKCGGLSTTCVGCDGRPDPNDVRRAKYDACELCNGTNSTCSLLLLVFNGSPCGVSGISLASAWALALLLVCFPLTRGV